MKSIRGFGTSIVTCKYRGVLGSGIRKRESWRALGNILDDPAVSGSRIAALRLVRGGLHISV